MKRSINDVGKPVSTTSDEPSRRFWEMLRCSLTNREILVLLTFFHGTGMATNTIDRNSIPKSFDLQRFRKRGFLQFLHIRKTKKNSQKEKQKEVDLNLSIHHSKTLDRNQSKKLGRLSERKVFIYIKGGSFIFVFPLFAS